MSVNDSAGTTPDIASLPGVELRPIGGRFGLEVAGLDLLGALDQPVIQAIINAIHRYKVVVFRGRHALDDARQEGLRAPARRHPAHPTVPSLEGTEAILKVDDSHPGSRASA